MAEKGKVKFYDWKKGFGFVTTDSGEDLFLHRTGIPQGIRVFAEDVIEFDIIEGPKGKNATNVKVISSTGKPPERAPQANKAASDDEEDPTYEDSDKF
ncbi:MAG: cold shock domain-containing protein [Candidatus Woesearchaeota archaeon]|jgi:CspA family cold shock protein